MELQDKEEKKNRKIGTAVSLGVHALLLLIFAFLLAWKEPNPPIPEYGIELNFGLDSQGSGEVQPEAVVEESESTSDAEEVNEDTPEENTESEEVQPEEQNSEPEMVEESTEAEEQVVTENISSPDVRKEEPVKAPVTTPEKVEEKPKEIVKKPTPEVTPEKKTTPLETKKEPVEKPSEKPSGGVASDKVVESKSQGDNTDAAGDKGNKEGTVDARALYGTPGGGGGASLDMAGWAWEEIPKPNDTSNESGRLVFEISVDDNGEVIGVRTLERGVSAAVEAIYKAEVSRLFFKRNPPDSPAPPRSVGKITFIIKSR